jgi:hypothetical protein
MAAEQDGVAAAINALRKSYDANTRDVQKISEAMNQRFGRQRLWMGVLAAVVILALFVGWGFRKTDNGRERDRRQAEHQRIIDQRANLIAGCGRSNEARAALRRVIERAYTPSPIPDGLPPDLRDLIVQSQERQASQRAEQLADPGVQPIDCEAAFPLPRDDQ